MILNRLNFFCILLVAIAAVRATSPLPAASPPPSPDRTGAPFVHLLTMVHDAVLARAINNLPPSEREARLAQLTRWYVHFNCPGSREFALGDPTRGPGSPDATLAARLAARGALVSNYRNGSYVSQSRRGELLFGETPALEREAPLAMLTWWPGYKIQDTGSAPDPAARLAEALSPEASTVRVTSAAAHRPKSAPSTWPYIPSRGKGAAAGDVLSESTADFVSWVRIGDEILRVLQVRGVDGVIELSVDRGYFHTTPAAHERGARVLSPVYIGSTRAAGWDTKLSGSPPVNNPDGALRYAVMAWHNSPADPSRDGAGWLARRIAETFGAGRPAPWFQGYNTVWLDITSCSPYNTADSYGQPVMPWDDKNEEPVSPETWTNYQVAKVKALRERLPAMGYPGLKLTANNLAWQGGPDLEYRNKIMGEAGLEGAALEHWLQRTAVWPAAMQQHFYIQQHDLPAIYWVKVGELDRQFNAPQYKRFTYGSYLLGWNPAAARPCLASHFGLKAPDDLFFWDFGQPLKPVKRLDDLLRLNGAWRRDFTNGAVLVNPTRQPIRCDLGKPFYDVSKPGPHQRVSSLTLAPNDAAFLLSSE